MLIGTPKETKDNEFRVGLTPGTVAELTHHGHVVIIEKSAGIGSGLADDEYRMLELRSSTRHRRYLLGLKWSSK
jgi:alanine dehydrogenase